MNQTDAKNFQVCFELPIMLFPYFARCNSPPSLAYLSVNETKPVSLLV